MRKIAQFLSAIALGVAALGAQAQAVNLVNNGSFSSALNSSTNWGALSGTIQRINNDYAEISASSAMTQSIGLSWNSFYALSFTTVGQGSVSLTGFSFDLIDVAGQTAAVQSFASGTHTYYFGTGAPVPNSGAYTHLNFIAGSQSFVIDNVSMNSISAIPAPVPEPETYAMMLAGLGAIGFLSRRRKNAA